MSKTDPGGALAALMRGHSSKGAVQINVALICRVLAYDEAKQTATVQPLIQSNDTPPAPIQAVPVLGHRYKVNGGAEQNYVPFLEVGDVVFVICADREIKNGLGGQVARPDTNQTHSLNDAVIVGIFPASLI